MLSLTPEHATHLHLRHAQHVEHVLQQQERGALPRAGERRCRRRLVLLLGRQRGEYPQGQVQQRTDAELSFVLISFRWLNRSGFLVSCCM